MSESESINIFGIYDNKAEYYSHIYLSPASPKAESVSFLRSVKAMRKRGIDDENASLLALYPEDFVLVHLGSIDKDNGSIFADEKRIAFGYDCLEQTIKDGE